MGKSSAFISDAVRSAQQTPSAPRVPDRDGERVLLVTDVRLYRDGLTYILEARDDIAMVCTAATLAEAIECIDLVQPTVVLFEQDGLDQPHALRSLSRAWPDAKIVAFGVGDREQDIVACAEAGLAGYVPRGASVDDLVSAIHSASRGELWCTPSAAGTLFRRVASMAARVPQESGFNLTGREQEIAELLARGLSNKEIARRLQIELATVKNHVHHILEKLNVRRRSEAAIRLLGGRLANDRPRASSEPLLPATPLRARV
jgi:DNA-binding NarL/FixJ family response regulator